MYIILILVNYFKGFCVVFYFFQGFKGKVRLIMVQLVRLNQDKYKVFFIFFKDIMIVWINQCLIFIVSLLVKFFEEEFDFKFFGILNFLNNGGLIYIYKLLYVEVLFQVNQNWV